MIFSLFWEGAFIRRGAFIRGSVYFKIRDFRGAFIRGRRLFEAGRLFEEIRYPLTRLIGLAVEMYRIKRLLNFLETCTLLIQQKITEKVGLYTNNT